MKGLIDNYLDISAKIRDVCCSQFDGISDTELTSKCRVCTYTEPGAAST